jgi:hypothetical protein
MSTHRAICNTIILVVLVCAPVWAKDADDTPWGVELNRKTSIADASLSVMLPATVDLSTRATFGLTVEGVHLDMHASQAYAVAGKDFAADVKTALVGQGVKKPQLEKLASDPKLEIYGFAPALPPKGLLFDAVIYTSYVRNADSTIQILDFTIGVIDVGVVATWRQLAKRIAATLVPGTPIDLAAREQALFFPGKHAELITAEQGLLVIERRPARASIGTMLAMAELHHLGKLGETASCTAELDTEAPTLDPRSSATTVQGVVRGTPMAWTLWVEGSYGLEAVFAVGNLFARVSCTASNLSARDGLRRMIETLHRP